MSVRARTRICRISVRARVRAMARIKVRVRARGRLPVASQGGFEPNSPLELWVVTARTQEQSEKDKNEEIDR